MKLHEMFLTEYLTANQRRRYARIKVRVGVRKLTDRFFGENNDSVRRDLPEDVSTEKGEVHLAIEKAIGQEISVEDYRRGIVKDRYNRDVKIGRLIRDEKLRNQFASDPARQGVRKSGYYATIHRGTEVAGQTNSAADETHPQGHSWGGQSCKNVDTGCNRHYLEQEIRAGTVVIFVHESSGKEIYRATLHPFFKNQRDRSEVVYALDAEYGVTNRQFTNFSKQIAKELSTPYQGNDSFRIDPNVYNDNSADTIVHPGMASTFDEIVALMAPYRENNYILPSRLRDKIETKILGLPDSDLLELLRWLLPLASGRVTVDELIKYILSNITDRVDRPVVKGILEVVQDTPYLIISVYKLAFDSEVVTISDTVLEKLVSELLTRTDVSNHQIQKILEFTPKLVDRVLSEISKNVSILSSNSAARSVFRAVLSKSNDLNETQLAQTADVVIQAVRTRQSTEEWRASLIYSRFTADQLRKLCAYPDMAKELAESYGMSEAMKVDERIVLVLPLMKHAVRAVEVFSTRSYESISLDTVRAIYDHYETDFDTNTLIVLYKCIRASDQHGLIDEFKGKLLSIDEYHFIRFVQHTESYDAFVKILELNDARASTTIAKLNMLEYAMRLTSRLEFDATKDVLRHLRNLPARALTGEVMTTIIRMLESSKWHSTKLRSYFVKLFPKDVFYAKTRRASSTYYREYEIWRNHE